MERAAKSNSRRAFTLPELLTVVAVLLVLAVLFWPRNRISCRGPYLVNEACKAKLHNLGLAMSMYASDNVELLPMQTKPFSTASNHSPSSAETYFNRIMPYLGDDPKSVICPSDVGRKIKSDDTSRKPTKEKISYFLNLDPTFSTNCFWSGDRNLTNNMPLPRPATLVLDGKSNFQWTSALHNNVGNILFRDGHAETMSTLAVRNLIRSNPTNSVRLLLPQ